MLFISWFVGLVVFFIMWLIMVWCEIVSEIVLCMCVFLSGFFGSGLLVLLVMNGDILWLEFMCRYIMWNIGILNIVIVGLVDSFLMFELGMFLMICMLFVSSVVMCGVLVVRMCSVMCCYCGFLF